jgi:RNA polymerase sigma factor (sigma-70 family)
VQEVTGEAELLRASLTGSKEAFGTVVEQYQSLICAITYSGTGDFERSEELAQETFVRAWKELSQLRDFDKFRGWLCTIARNLVRKSIKRGCRDVISHAQPLEKVEPVESAEQGPSEAAISKEQQAIVWGALEGISEQYREPMVLFYREQQSVREVASGLGLTEEATRQRLSRGRQMLKENVAALVEETIGRTRPSKVFTVAVVAALPALTPQVASAATTGAAAKGSVATKSAAVLSLIGEAVAPLLVLAGWIINLRATVVKIKSVRERKFIITMVSIWFSYCFVSLAGIVFMMELRPTQIRFWLVLFMVAAAGGIVLAFIIKRQRKVIQIEEGTYVEPERRMLERSKGQIYGAFGGGIFGSLLWLQGTTARARDWAAWWIVLSCGVLLFLLATRLCIRAKRYNDRVAMGTFTAIGVLYLLVVNLRWERWMAYFVESGRYLRYTRISLWQVNLVIAAVTAVLVLVFLLGELRQRKMRRREEQTKAK